MSESESHMLHALDVRFDLLHDTGLSLQLLRGASALVDPLSQPLDVLLGILQEQVVGVILRSVFQKILKHRNRTVHSKNKLQTAPNKDTYKMHSFSPRYSRTAAYSRTTMNLSILSLTLRDKITPYKTCLKSGLIDLWKI